MSRTFNIRDLGAIGDGYADDTTAIYTAIRRATDKSHGCVVVPAGDYLTTSALNFTGLASRLSVIGEGKASTIWGQGVASGLRLNFAQNGVRQPWGLDISNLQFSALGACGTALTTSYGNPAETQDHSQPSTRISDVSVISSDEGHWSDGIEIEAAWRPTLHNVHISGNDHGGNWNALSGSGINLRRMCINAQISNCSTNFWAEGIRAHSEGEVDTEGIFCSNNSMVAVKRGAWLKGRDASRIDTFQWIGGMVEIRCAGVTGGSAAFHLEHVHSASIVGCRMLPDTKDGCPETTYGIIAQGCRDITASSNVISSFRKGIFYNAGSEPIMGSQNIMRDVDVPYSGG